MVTFKRLCILYANACTDMYIFNINAIIPTLVRQSVSLNLKKVERKKVIGRQRGPFLSHTY